MHSVEKENVADNTMKNRGEIQARPLRSMSVCISDKQESRCFKWFHSIAKNLSMLFPKGIGLQITIQNSTQCVARKRITKVANDIKVTVPLTGNRKCITGTLLVHFLPMCYLTESVVESFFLKLYLRQLTWTSWETQFRKWKCNEETVWDKSFDVSASKCAYSSFA